MGWVQVKRNGNACTIKAKITPEHNVKKKQYVVICNIDEQSGKVIDVQCHDCAASLGTYITMYKKIDLLKMFKINFYISDYRWL